MSDYPYRLNVQTYLKDKLDEGLTIASSLDALYNELGIKAKLYEDECDRMILLNYGPNNSPKTHPIVIECRSLILDLDTLEVVSKRFDRFFNLGECDAFYRNFYIGRATIMEKADGSMVAVYYRNGSWRISTRSMANAEGYHPSGGTFRERILEAFGFENENKFQEFFNSGFKKNLTFVFEYVSPENRIVTPYAEPCMILTGLYCGIEEFRFWIMEDVARTMEEAGLRVRVPEVYSSVESYEELLGLIDQLDELEEGFVAWDFFSGKRLKVKSKTYLAAHALRGENSILGRKDFLGLVLNGDSDEFVTYYPEYSEQIQSVKDEIEEFELFLISKWETIKNIEDQKAFAEAVSGLAASYIFFTARKTNKHPVHVFRSMAVNQKLKIFL